MCYYSVRSVSSVQIYKIYYQVWTLPDNRVCRFINCDTYSTRLRMLMIEPIGRGYMKYSVTSSLFPWTYSFSFKRASFKRVFMWNVWNIFLSTEVGCGYLSVCLWSCFPLVVCSLFCPLPQEQGIKGEFRTVKAYMEDLQLVYFGKGNVASWRAMWWRPELFLNLMILYDFQRLLSITAL